MTDNTNTIPQPELSQAISTPNNIAFHLQQDMCGTINCYCISWFSSFYITNIQETITYSVTHFYFRVFFNIKFRNFFRSLGMMNLNYQTKLWSYFNNYTTRFCEISMILGFKIKVN